MAAGGQQKFSRFGEKRKIGSDTSGYDEYVEGVEADETSSLETPLKEDNMGFKLIQKMGWNSGTGLGKFEQGRVDPVPFEMKDDHMGLGRWTMELELAQDATEKRRQLEAEKELSEDLMESYRQQAEKEKKMNEVLTEMNKAFYCELCERQYTKYSEWDNHINSYSHHHQQRLRDLKQYETGRRFGGHRSVSEAKEKMAAAQAVAIERAQMRIRQERKRRKGGVTPGFKPIGEGSGGTMASMDSFKAVGSKDIQAIKSVQDSNLSEKLANKRKKFMSFQSAGTLISIGDNRIEKDTPLCKDITPIMQEREKDQKEAKGPEVQRGSRKVKVGGVTIDIGQKASYTSMWEKAGEGAKKNNAAPLPSSLNQAPPPLMSRQRELIMEKAADQNDLDNDAEDFTTSKLVKKKTGFKFNISKK